MRIPMTLQDLISTLPLLILSASILTVMLVTAFKRSHKLTFGLTIIGLVLSLASLPFASHGLPHPVTPLLVVDGFAIFYIALVLITSLVVVVISYNYMDKVAGNKDEYYLLILLAALGATTLTVSDHFVSFFLGLEILSIALYTLIGYTRFQHHRVEAAIKYLILAAAAAAFLLFGMALVYIVFGTMHFMVPFHMWAPDVYQGAPAPVTAFVATVSKGGIFALMLRLFAHVPLTAGSALWNIVAVIAIASMLVGNVLPLTQNNVKRILAYSSIAQFGYLLVPFLAGKFLASSMTFYLVVYIVSLLMAFGVISLLSEPQKEFEDLETYRGLLRQRPGYAVLLTLSLMSLASLPPTGGLVGKIFLAAAGVKAALWLPLAALVIGTIIGVFYYLRIVITMFRQADVEDRTTISVSRGANVVLALLGVLIILLGIYPTPLVHIIEQIVASLS